MRFSAIASLLLALVCTACFEKNREAKRQKAELECTTKTKIDGFNILFMGYFPEDASEINVRIKRGNTLVKQYSDTIPLVIDDSLRHSRWYRLNQEILLTDTVLLSIDNGETKKVYDFEYTVRPLFTMLSQNWACLFDRLTVDGSVEEGGAVIFEKEGWKILDREDFEIYYKQKR
ncbi:hypothetical protein AAG747_23115 [Rapidithrix thailandica]|uniref:Lipoprotein n=1 Tax=Rapidithrix thailandica TaxID=413964 RepID=A0AAW9SE61_9BACT